MFPFNKLWISLAVDDLRLPVVDDPVDAVVVRLGRLPRGVEVGRVDGVLRRQQLDERSDALVHDLGKYKQLLSHTPLFISFGSR